ncbi:hypothetical protein BXT84_00065 [Sulfobacillus thermotolerans]|uniref:DUF1700 domain-containing protein n=1 Tax=Sulfobacillus thermotolerans TaxID=338644 RepID=A0ABM6RMJ1_9FIRM|nr:hypothetical protein BXT84_00065 [Sulfobacillus thermotolerans]
MDVNKQEILAILQANRALGPDYDEHTADQILDLIMQKSPETPEDVAAYLAQLSPHDQRVILRRFRKNQGSGSVAGLFVLSIPLMAIAGGVAHSAGVFAVVLLDAVAVIASALKR